MMTTIKEGEALFAQGKIEEAEKFFLDLLESDPKNAEILNNVGVIHHTTGDLQEAEGYFLKSVEAKEDYLDALLNLADLYQNAKRWEEGALHLEKCIAINDKDPNLYNQLGIIYLEMGDSQKAREVLAKSLKLNPGQEIVRQSLSALEKKDASSKDSKKEKGKAEAFINEAHSQQKRRTKIAVLCLPGLQSFLRDIVDFLKTKYDVRTYYGKNNQEIESAVQWADIVWLEWANELAIHVTNNVPSISQKQVICRIHSYEVLHGYLPRINWSRISKTIFVADHVVKIARDIYPAISQLTECFVVNNGVNLEKFQFKERKPGFNIAVVGHINHKKNPSMWVEVISRLVEIDDRYTLKVAGEFQELRYKYYMESIVPKLGLTNNIRFFGHVDDVAKWFETNDINYLLTTSPFESFGYSIAEAMAMGYRPLIHAFAGAEDIWPIHCIFYAINELIDMVRNRRDYDSRIYREFVEAGYSLRHQLENVDSLVRSLGKKNSDIIGILRTAEEKNTPERTFSFFGSSEYWERRYNNGGTSGAGSYGKLAEFKAEVLNAFVRENDVRTVVEFGCGDGNQLSLASYPAYIGLDVSKTAIRRCQQLFRHEKTKKFFLYEPNRLRNEHHNYRAELALSLDVIYHIIEDDAFELYMEYLFSAAEKYVIIYSSDFTGYSPSPHIRYRRISEWNISRFPEWKLLEKIPNRYPYDGDDRTGSLSDFYIYRKSCSNSALKGIAPNGDNAKKNDQLVSFIHQGQEVTLMLSDTDEHLSGIIRSHNNFYELQMLDDIRKRVPTSGVFVDCGANIGNHGVYFGVICKASKVYAFEPMKETYNILLKNISLNKLDGIIVGYSIALGKENTNGKLIVRDANNLGTSIIQECPEGDIVIRKLDDIVFADNDRGFKGIDLVKIDVEGMELDVLRGAKKVINKFSPLLYVEIQTDDELRAILDFLSPYGYEPKLRFNWTPTFLFETNKRRM